MSLDQDSGGAESAHERWHDLHLDEVFAGIEPDSQIGSLAMRLFEAQDKAAEIIDDSQGDVSPFWKLAHEDFRAACDQTDAFIDVTTYIDAKLSQLKVDRIGWFDFDQLVIEATNDYLQDIAEDSAYSPAQKTTVSKLVNKIGVLYRVEAGLHFDEMRASVQTMPDNLDTTD